MTECLTGCPAERPGPRIALTSALNAAEPLLPSIKASITRRANEKEYSCNLICSVVSHLDTFRLPRNLARVTHLDSLTSHMPFEVRVWDCPMNEISYLNSFHDRNLAYAAQMLRFRRALGRLGALPHGGHAAADRHITRNCIFSAWPVKRFHDGEASFFTSMH